MKPQEIIEGNKLVDIFMDNWLVSRGFSETELNYHSDWNLLMPVVEKIAIGNSYYLSNDCGEWQVLIDKANVNVVSNELHLATWLAVIEFIKWYNEKVK